MIATGWDYPALLDCPNDYLPILQDEIEKRAKAYGNLWRD